MAYEEYTLAERGDVLVQLALPGSSGYDTPEAIGCLIGSVTENDGMEDITVDINTWCEQQARAAGSASIRQSRPGDRDYTVTFDLAVIVADGSSWRNAIAAYRAREQVQLVITISDNEQSQATVKKTLTGYFSNFDTEYPQDGVAHSPITFRVLDEMIS